MNANETTENQMGQIEKIQYLICGNCKKFPQCSGSSGKLYTDMACQEFIKKRGRPSTMPARQVKPVEEPKPVVESSQHITEIPKDAVPVVIAPEPTPVNPIMSGTIAQIPEKNLRLIWTAKFKERYHLLSAMLDNGRRVIICGEAGAGKNQLVREYCAERKLALLEVSCSGDMRSGDLLGRYVTDATGNLVWQDGLITQMARRPGVLVLDEMNALDAEILFSLHKARNGENGLITIPRNSMVVKCHPEFRLVGTMNPLGYLGTKGLNSALLDGFDMLAVEYDSAIDRKMLKKFSILDDAQRTTIMSIVDKVRKSSASGDLTQPLGHRTLDAIIQLSGIFVQTFPKNELGENLRLAFDVGYFSKLTPDEKPVVKTIYDSLMTELKNFKNAVQSANGQTDERAIIGSIMKDDENGDD